MSMNFQSQRCNIRTCIEIVCRKWKWWLTQRFLLSFVFYGGILCHSSCYTRVPYTLIFMSFMVFACLIIVIKGRERLSQAIKSWPSTQSHKSAIHNANIVKMNDTFSCIINWFPLCILVSFGLETIRFVVSCLLLISCIALMRQAVSLYCSSS